MVTWRSPRTWSFAVSNFSDRELLQTPLADGWGATTDGAHLIVGDSSETLTFIGPGSMQAVRSVRVTGGPAGRVGRPGWQHGWGQGRAGRWLSVAPKNGLL